MITIRTPNPQFSGERAGVNFRHGQAQVAELTGRQRQAFAALGYTVDEPWAARPIADLKVDELRRLAEREGIDLAGARKKDDILAAIEAARNPQPSSGEEDADAGNSDDDAPVEVVADTPVEVAVTGTPVEGNAEGESNAD